MIRPSIPLLLVTILLIGPLQGGSVLVDGKLEEDLWRRADQFQLQPAEKGVPLDLAASAKALSLAGHLYLGAVIPEPGGKVLAYSVGYNPNWEVNASTYFLGLDRLLPPTEDRFVYRLRYTRNDGVLTTLQLEVNPWGAIRLERDGLLVPESGILAEATINKEGWLVEVVIPLTELGADSAHPDIELELEQIRSRRPLAPEYRWRLQRPLQIAGANAPQQLQPKKKTVGETLKVGRVQVLPPLDSRWEDPFWDNVPTLELSRNEQLPRPPHYPTSVKWVHDGRTLAIFFRNTEDTRVACTIQRRDHRVEVDDHVFVYLATSGSSLVEILVNATGAIKDQEGIRNNLYFGGVGEWRKGYSHTNWDADIKTHPLITKDHWFARIDIPLDQVAAALGSTPHPSSWKVLLGRVRQKRIGEPRELSSLPVIGSPSFRAPARYLPLNLSQAPPSTLAHPATEYRAEDATGLARELAELDSFVLKRLERRYHNLPNMLNRSVSRRVTALAMEEHQEWAGVTNLKEWEKYRDKRIDLLKASFGDFPKSKTPLEARVTGTFKGDGFQVQNIVFQSRHGVFVPANLYLPLEPLQNMPAIIINPGHGMPKTQEVNKDCGMIWARAGCAVLVPEKVGHGERIETLPWNNRAYYSEELHDMQLGLIGQSRQGWIAWDISRAVDFLLELGNIDPERIILMGGATWGAGPTAAAAGFLEDRLAATVIFNFGRLYWFTGGGWRLKNCTTMKIPDWFFCASKAPRKFIYAHEFWFEGEEGPDYPSVWAPAWPRYEQVYSFYDARENLANAQSDGLLRLDTGHCGSIDHLARREIYPLLQKWFGIPEPGEEDFNIEYDSQYGPDRADYPLIKFKEAQRRMPDHELICITPQLNAQLPRQPLHKIARARGVELLETARERRSVLDRDARRRDLRAGLETALGDIHPTGKSKSETLWKRSLKGTTVEGLLLHTEVGILVPVLLLKPETGSAQPGPTIVALAEGGKDRFLKHRSEEIASLIRAGFTICLPDLRGTGETTPDQYKTQSHYQLYDEIALGNTLVGLRLKDVRTLLSYLRTRSDVDATRIGLWGESFAPVNQEEIWVDELTRSAISPQIQHLASPLGPAVALLAALYEPDIKAVAIRRGLASYLSLLDNPFVYIPFDSSVPGMLRAGDLPDVVEALAPLPLLAEHLVGGRNFLIPGEYLEEMLGAARNAYQQLDASSNLVLRSEGKQPDLTRWLSEQLADTR